MPSSITDLELRLADVQAQLDRLSHTAAQRSVPVEERLAALADQYDAYLKRWGLAIEWHARAVTQLEAHVNDWKDAAGHVQEDAADRLQKLEAIVDREWAALRKIHELPVAELRQQAASLTEISIATASAAQQGLDRTEARLAAFERDFHHAIGELTRELRAALTEFRLRPAGALAASHGSTPWSFEDVTRLHGQLRDGLATPPAADDRARAPVPLLPAAVTLDAEPVVQPTSSRRSWKPIVAAVAIAGAVVAGFGWYLRQEVRASTARAERAEQIAQRAVTDAASRADIARSEAAREIATAREAAARTQRIGDIMAAPDLVRYNLAPGDGTTGPTGRAMWSRSRGLLVSASHMPRPPSGGAYNIWLFTRGGPLPAGTLTRGADGTATMIREPIDTRRAIIGVAVTAEASADIDRPSGPVILTSVQPVSPAPDQGPAAQN